MKNNRNVLVNYLKQMSSEDLEWLSFAFGCMETDAEQRNNQIAEHMLKDMDLEPFFTNDCIDDPAGLNPGCEEICILCENNDIEWPVLIPVFVMWLLHRELTDTEDKMIQTVIDAYLDDTYPELRADFEDLKYEVTADCAEDIEMLHMVRVILKMLCEPEFLVEYFRDKLEEETDRDTKKLYRKAIRFFRTNGDNQ